MHIVSVNLLIDNSSLLFIWHIIDENIFKVCSAFIRHGSNYSLTIPVISNNFRLIISEVLVKIGRVVFVF